MRVVLARVSFVVLLLFAVALAGALPIFSDSARQDDSIQAKGKGRAARPAASPLSYRSPGASHKIILPADDLVTQFPSRAGRRSRRYASYTLIEVSDAELQSLAPAALERAQVRDDLNLVLLRRGQIDTTAPPPQVRSDLRQPEGLPRSLRLAQLFGPPTPDDWQALKATGVKVISYIPNNAYLVWATQAQLARLGDRADHIQWEGPFHPAYKIDPGIKLDSLAQVPVSIEIVSTPESAQTVKRIKAHAAKVLMPAFQVAGVVHLKVLIESSKLAQVARVPDVMAIEPWAKPELMDERANQIVAGALSVETTGSIQVGRPSTPGYLTFLNALGFNSTFDFAVDVADTGLDRGGQGPPNLHPDFLDAAGNTRIAYLFDYTGDGALHNEDPAVLAAHDAQGHGTLDASIIGGYNVSPDSAFRDNLGFQYGLGVAPFARIGVSKIFNDNAAFSSDLTFDGYAYLAYRSGARIASHSWGLCDEFSGFCNVYNGDSRALDALTRDADTLEAGNQEMLFVFAAGNEGGLLPQTIAMPGTAKNVITVGASESFRATLPDGSELKDGCDVPGTAADNALDLLGFSGNGPVQDGRAKPDLVAPGTHIVGAAPQDNFYAAKPEDQLGVCNRYFPAGQTFYSLSSGTSHSTPIVTGAAALAFQWLKQRLGQEPSPALVKAFLLNSTSYLTGRFGGDNLPGSRQGWGLLNLSRMFEQTARITLDQSPARAFTQSGGTPFEITGVISDPAKEFRVMLAWTDAPGLALSNAPYVNQLNLEVIVGGVVYQGNNFNGQYSTPGGQKDFLNNVQAIRLPAGATGPFVIRVRPTVIAGDGVPHNGSDLDQDFALVVTNGSEAAVPVLAAREANGVAQGVTVTHPGGATDGSLIPGETAAITVPLANDSRTAAANITSATLTLSGVGNATAAYPVIAAAGSAVNSEPFRITIPSGLRCGSVAEFQLRLTTDVGDVILPIRVRVGRLASQSALLDDDVDGRRVKWKLKKGFALNTSTGNSGTSSYRAVDEGDRAQLSSALLKKGVAIPENAGNVRLTFFHIFNFEPGFDGGVLEISTDGGATFQDIGSRILVGGYDGKVTAASENPLGNRFAWTARGRPGVFSPVVVNLDEFAGQRIRLRFLAGFDGATGQGQGYTGWFIDDIRITADTFACR